MIRRLAVEERDADFRVPDPGEYLHFQGSQEKGMLWRENIREATVAATLMNRYADILILGGTEIWELMPPSTLRQGLYTDPKEARRPRPWRL